MSTVTTGMCSSFKAEVVQGGHCFNAIQSALTCTCSTTVNMTALSGVGTANIAVGMGVTGTNSAANTFVSAIISTTALTLSVASTGALTAPTFTADSFKFALITGTPTNSYTNTMTNYGTGSGSPTTVNLGTDEVASGGGYTTGGILQININPTFTAGSGAWWQFTTNPSWTAATFSTLGGMLYNTSQRLGGAAGTFANRAVSIHSFGGVQTVSAGTFTVLQPTNGSATSLLQIN